MPRAHKSVDTDKQKQKRQSGPIEKGREQTGVARPGPEAPPWATANKLHSGGKNFASRRKLPSGPLGGSGRKTNRARSS